FDLGRLAVAIAVAALTVTLTFALDLLLSFTGFVALTALAAAIAAVLTLTLALATLATPTTVLAIAAALAVAFFSTLLRRFHRCSHYRLGRFGAKQRLQPRDKTTLGRDRSRSRRLRCRSNFRTGRTLGTRYR
ncbi:hypothetical protein, partial [Enterobacter hormaechei]|uniref:hypothetical protein n=1 Tax=Enterobacter hormaechei TaxID=158836 RepID=UPI0015826AD7